MSFNSPSSDAFDAATAQELAVVVDHMNDNHADSILLMARSLVSGRALVDAEVVGVDRRGVEFAVRGDDGHTGTARFDFGGRPADLDALRGEVFGLLSAARAAAGDAVPLTSLEREIAAVGRLPTLVTTVARTAEVSPNLREITFAGGFDGVEPLGADQFFYLAVPHHDDVVIAPGFSMGDIDQLGDDVRPATAYYTVRRWRPEADEIDMWFVRHDHAGGVSRWAASAEPGHVVAMWGPRRGFDPPPGTTSYLLVADETGLPAVAAILEELGDGTTADVVIETVDADHHVPLAGGPAVRTVWVHRGDDPPGTGDRLLAAVHDLGVTAGGRYAFGAAESRQVTAVRRYLRNEIGMPGTHVRMTGYWRRTGTGG